MTRIKLTFFRADIPNELNLMIDDQLRLEQVLVLLFQEGFISRDYQDLDGYLLTRDERCLLSKEVTLVASEVRDEDMLLIQRKTVDESLQDNCISLAARPIYPPQPYRFPYSPTLEVHQRTGFWVYEFSEYSMQRMRLPSIAILQCLLEEIFTQASNRQQQKVFGILEGGIFYDPESQEPWVEILDIFPTSMVNTLVSSPEVFREELEIIQREAATISDRSQGVIRLVGWYHVHLDQGIFLSPSDRIIQAEMFSESWQVALVVDPIRKQYGMFTGPECTPLIVGLFVIPDEEVQYFGTHSYQSWKRAMYCVYGEYTLHE